MSEEENKESVNEELEKGPLTREELESHAKTTMRIIQTYHGFMTALGLSQAALRSINGAIIECPMCNQPTIVHQKDVVLCVCQEKEDGGKDSGSEEGSKD